MAYVTLTEADTYMDDIYNNEDWTSATDPNKTRAIAESTKLIDRLNFKGEKTSDTQTNEFPRNDETDVPQDIKDACCEMALRLVQGIDPELEDEARRVTQSAFANVKTTYKDADSELPHVIAGIPCAKAWRLLLPYLSDVNSFSTYRV